MNNYYCFFIEKSNFFFQDGTGMSRRHTVVLSSSSLRINNRAPRPYSATYGFADCSASSDPPSPVKNAEAVTFSDPPPNSRAPSDEDQVYFWNYTV